jgi:hypothetical protein
MDLPREIMTVYRDLLRNKWKLRLTRYGIKVYYKDGSSSVRVDHGSWPTGIIYKYGIYETQGE